MSALIKLLKLPQNFHCSKQILLKCPRRNESSSPAAQRSTRGTILKASFIGISVGVFTSIGYSIYTSIQNAKNYHLEGTVHKIEALKEKPQVPVSRQIIMPTDQSGLKLTLFQYQTCPFCCKVRVFLDYYGLSYDVVEVDPVLRKEISWSSYKKVPILLTDTASGYQPLNDSSMIISLIASHLKDNSQKIEELMNYYPSIAMHDKDDKLRYEILNKYYLMYTDKFPKNENFDDIIEERKWRKWADDILVHSLSPNVYRTLDEAYHTFNWFSNVGRWKEYFPAWERFIMINVGALAMWMISKRLKKRHHLKEDVRQSLYDDINEWLRAIKARGGKFMGGERPNLADLGVYGILKSIEGCTAFQDALNNTKLTIWYSAMTKEVEAHSGSKYLVN
ncbi:prostaglandin E synthase Su(P) [Megalopta genalis]|uniref:prostaglandin E synthase Su(P) n=1 Tax=Megalopta genalis TaxID=115081 RepID=UPI00144369E6|nr:prostaglandin E synthase 2 [Megalopta genalis]